MNLKHLFLLLLIAIATITQTIGQNTNGCDGSTFVNLIKSDGIKESLIPYNLVNEISYLPDLDTIKLEGWTKGSANCYMGIRIYYDDDTIPFMWDDGPQAILEFKPKEGNYRIETWVDAGIGYNIHFRLLLDTKIGFKQNQGIVDNPPFPNPFNDFLQIPISDKNNLKRIAILNVSGSVLYSIDHPKEDLILNLSSAPTGLYLVKYISENGVSFTKLTKN